LQLQSFSVSFGFVGHLEPADFVKMHHTWSAFHSCSKERYRFFFNLLYNLTVGQGKNFWVRRLKKLKGKEANKVPQLPNCLQGSVPLVFLRRPGLHETYWSVVLSETSSTMQAGGTNSLHSKADGSPSWALLQAKEMDTARAHILALTQIVFACLMPRRRIIPLTHCITKAQLHIGRSSLVQVSSR